MATGHRAARRVAGCQVLEQAPSGVRFGASRNALGSGRGEAAGAADGGALGGERRNAVEQLMDFGGVDALGQLNCEPRGDCWALAFQGGRSDAGRLLCAHAALRLHVRLPVDGGRAAAGRRLASRSVRKLQRVSPEERQDVGRVRMTVWDVMDPTRPGQPLELGVVSHQPTVTTLQEWRRELAAMGRRRWTAEPGATMSEWEGSHAFQVLAYWWRINVVVLRHIDWLQPNPNCLYYDGASGGATDGNLMRLAAALPLVSASPLPYTIVLFYPGHFHCIRLNAETDAELQTHAEEVRKLRAELRVAELARRRPEEQRVAAGGSSGVPYPAWYGEEKGGRYGAVAQAFVWCCYHAGGVGEYRPYAEFSLGGSVAADLRYCIGCSTVQRSRSSPRSTAPSMAQCLAHVPNLSKQRRHIFTSTCCYDGAKAAAFLLEHVDREAAEEEMRRHSGEAEQARLVRLARAHITSLELALPDSSVERAFMRGRTRWLENLRTATSLDGEQGLLSLCTSLASSLIADSIHPDEEPDEAIAAIGTFQQALRECSAAAQLVEAVASLSAALGFDLCG